MILTSITVYALVWRAAVFNMTFKYHPSTELRCNVLYVFIIFDVEYIRKTRRLLLLFLFPFILLLPWHGKSRC